VNDLLSIVDFTFKQKRLEERPISFPLSQYFTFSSYQNHLVMFLGLASFTEREKLAPYLISLFYSVEALSLFFFKCGIKYFQSGFKTFTFEIAVFTGIGIY
jgi:hypothetical protein